MSRKDIKVNSVEQRGWSALHAATDKCHSEMQALLLDNQADIQLLTQERWSVLDIAILKGTRQMLQSLIDRGAGM